MLFASQDELIQHLKGTANLDNGGVKLDNPDKFRADLIDGLVKNSVLNESADVRGLSRFIIKSAAHEMGIISSSIQGLYDARVRG